MRARVLGFVMMLAVALPSFAVDPGRAEGKMVVNGTSYDLVYAYAVPRQKNQITNRNDDVKIILTDKPLAPDANLRDMDFTFPDGILGLVVCIDRDKQISHVVVQHPNGTYDAGYFSNIPEYRYRPRKTEPDTIGGAVLVTRPMATATIQFTFDVNFSAALR